MWESVSSDVSRGSSAFSSSSSYDSGFAQCIASDVKCEICLLTSSTSGCDCTYSLCWVLEIIVGCVASILLICCIACCCCRKKTINQTNIHNGNQTSDCRCLSCAEMCFSAGRDINQIASSIDGSEPPYQRMEEPASLNAGGPWGPGNGALLATSIGVDGGWKPIEGAADQTLILDALALQSVQMQPEQIVQQQQSQPVQETAKMLGAAAPAIDAAAAAAATVPATAKAPAIPDSLSACLGFPKTEKEINKSLAESIRPTEDEKKKIGRLMETLRICLTKHSKSVVVTRICKIGSQGKGTAIRSDADLDVVVYAQSLVLGAESVPLAPQNVFRRFREVFVKELMWSFQECRECEGGSRRDCVSKAPFGFSAKVEGVGIDVGVAYDLLAECSVDGVVSWADLVERLHGSEFNASLAELQKRFVRDRLNECDRLKDLSLLVKFWYKRVVRPRYGGARAPSYFFELVCLHHWEKGLNRSKGFRLVAGLRGVLEALKQPKGLNIFWTVNYSKEEVRSETLIDFPLVLDPANPTNNLAKFEDPRVWASISAAAADALEEEIFKG